MTYLKDLKFEAQDLRTGLDAASCSVLLSFWVPLRHSQEVYKEAVVRHDVCSKHVENNVQDSVGVQIETACVEKITRVSRPAIFQKRLALIHVYFNVNTT